MEEIEGKKNITKDCNIILKKLDSKKNADMTKMISKQCSIVENNTRIGKSSKVKRNKKAPQVGQIGTSSELKNKGCNGKVGVVLTRSNKQIESALLKNNKTLKKVGKRVSFKVPLVKYQQIRPLKKKKTKKLMIMLTRCDNIVKS